MVLRRTGAWDILLDKLDESKPASQKKTRSEEKDDKDKASKLDQALTTIGLTVDTSQYQYIENCSDGAKAWKALMDVL